MLMGRNYAVVDGPSILDAVAVAGTQHEYTLEQAHHGTVTVSQCLSALQGMHTASTTHLMLHETHVITVKV